MRSLRVAAAVFTLAAACALPGCPSGAPLSSARKITDRAELIGGPRALGEVGDWLIQNDKVRFIVQDAGFSRGFGVFGGALLDADLVRKTSGRGSSDGGVGKDNFGEMFPAFFLEALEPREVRDPNDKSGERKLAAIEVENDGSKGDAAVLVVRGTGGDFIALTESINEILLQDDRQIPTLMFETRYILEPGAQYLKMTTRVQNISPEKIAFTSAELLGAQVPTPFGDVLLFGAGNKVFAPTDAGFDIRFTLEKIYAKGDIALPALPGIAAEFVASSGKDVSYGLLAEKPTAPAQNFVAANAGSFPGSTDHSLHIPFIASAFTGVFQALPPDLLANDQQPGGADEMEFTRYFFVGDGDVASISDQVYALLGDKTGRVAGKVRFEQSGEGVTGGSVVVVDGAGKKVTQAKIDEGGRFQADLRPGTYDLVIVKAGLQTTTKKALEIKAGETTRAVITVPLPAQLVVTAVEKGGGRVPAKVTLVGTTPSEHVGEKPSEWLFDLSLGEDFRYTDFVADDAANEDTLRVLEDFKYAGDGTATLTARPGRYTVVVGRGPEYTRVEQEVELVAGKTVAIDATLERVVDTTGYVGGDFHLHSVFSLDSNASLQDRITSYAGEGVELAVSTDHNFVVDYRPVIEKAGLSRFINSAIGLELTTIDRGHFNGFPLQRGSGALLEDEDGDIDTIASKTYGSFEWALRNPADIFADLRSRGRVGADGKPGPIVLQVNHPRDSILGYFDQYGVNADTLEPEGLGDGPLAPSTSTHPEFKSDAFSFDFDAIEVFNGKRFEFLNTLRVPEGVTRDPVSCCPLSVGDVVRDRPGPDCGNDVEDADCNCSVAVCDRAPAACDEREAAQVAAGKCAPDDTRFDVAYPGVVDDWIKLLLTGKHVVGTGNSDSHEPEKEEPGSPRTYLRVASDAPSQVGPDDIVAAFQSGDVLMTNGPFVRVHVGDKGMGGTVTGDKQTLSIHVEQAPWVKADTLKVYRGTEVVREEAFDGTKRDFTIEVDTPADTVLLVEVSSTKESSSLFPSVYPNEIPPLQFTDVIGSLGSSFGIGAPEGALEPRLVSVTTPFAMTNPIWVDVSGDGFDAPRTIPGVQAQTARHHPRQVSLTRPVVTVPTAEEARREEARAAWDAVPLRKKLALSRLPRWLWPSNDPRDVRRSLVQFTRHSDP